MKNRTVAKALLIVAVVAVAVGLVAGALILNPGYGSTPHTTAPSGTTAARTSPEPSPPAPEPLEDIDGLPVHITVLHADKPIIDADIVVITLDRDGVLAPPKGKAGVYYSPTDWSTVPGNHDRYRGIIAGHDVTGTGARDVFYNLGKVTEGDRIVLTYKLTSGGTTTAQFTVTMNATSVPKTDVVHSSEYSYLWQPMSKSGRYLSVLSCDLSKADPGQHSRNNWVVNAVRQQ